MPPLVCLKPRADFIFLYCLLYLWFSVLSFSAHSSNFAVQSLHLSITGWRPFGIVCFLRSVSLERGRVDSWVMFVSLMNVLDLSRSCSSFNLPMALHLVFFFASVFRPGLVIIWMYVWFQYLGVRVFFFLFPFELFGVISLRCHVCARFFFFHLFVSSGPCFLMGWWSPNLCFILGSRYLQKRGYAGTQFLGAYVVLVCSVWNFIEQKGLGIASFVFVSSKLGIFSFYLLIFCLWVFWPPKILVHFSRYSVIHLLAQFAGSFSEHFGIRF